MQKACCLKSWKKDVISDPGCIYGGTEINIKRAGTIRLESLLSLSNMRLSKLVQAHRIWQSDNMDVYTLSAVF